MKYWSSILITSVFVKKDLMNFIVDYLDLIFLFFIKEHIDFVTSTEEISTINAKVAENFLLSILKPDFRVTVDEEKFIIDHPQNIFGLIWILLWIVPQSIQSITFFVGQREEQSLVFHCCIFVINS